MVDDILDVTADEATLGKPVGSDAAQSKSTYVSLLGLSGARAMAQRSTGEAVDALAVFGEDAAPLRRLAEHLMTRTF